MNDMTQLARAIVGGGRKAASSEHLATVLKKSEDGTYWVRILGGAEETPITTPMVEAADGDTVHVSISGGRSIMTGNVTSPTATGRSVMSVSLSAKSAQQTANDALDAAGLASKAALDAVDSAQVAAESAAYAQASANEAQTYANEANAKANEANGVLADMQVAANAAGTSLTAIYQNVSDAQDSADDAMQAAEAAQTSANTALANADDARASAMNANTSAIASLKSLSDVEKVIGSVNWIAEHGRYVSAAGTTFDDEAVYYTTKNVTYGLTSDESIVAGKVYYTRSGSGTESDPYVYTRVANPVVSEISTYYEIVDADYEVVSQPVEADIDSYYYLVVDESVQNYIAAHVALTDDGLWLMGDASTYRALLSADGLEIRDQGGHSVALYGDTFRIGSLGNVHLLGTSTRIAFHTEFGDIAYFGMDSNNIWQMYIQQAEVTNMMRFGNYVWVKRSNGNMTIKYVGGE